MTSPWAPVSTSAFEYFAALVAEDEHFPLLEAAVSVGLDDEPLLDIEAVLSEVDGLAQRLKSRLPADAGAVQRLRALNRYFFKELGFCGNVNDYYAAENSLIHRVLSTRRGIPISLALLYMEIADQIGLQVQGVSFPGHFLVKLRLPAGEVVMDPFSGRSLSREALEERLEPFRQRQGLVGDFDAPLGLFLQSSEPRYILARMLGNLKALYREQQDWPRLLGIQERLVALLPEAWEEVRDRGLVLAELGLDEPAQADLSAYLAHRPDAADAPLLQAHLEQLRSSPRPLLH
ncbi:MAG: transglutaminase [Ideonella sp. MAG2]|nr:MAG: transglutaminase [Ideonella sp. MAG2]